MYATTLGAMGVDDQVQERTLAIEWGGGQADTISTSTTLIAAAVAAGQLERAASPAGQLGEVVELPRYYIYTTPKAFGCLRMKKCKKKI